MGVFLPVLPPALELALQILMMGYVESEVACFEAENSKGMSRTGGLVELPSFFEGETKILSCFSENVLGEWKSLCRAASTRRRAATAWASVCKELSAGHGWHARLNFSFSDKAAEFVFLQAARLDLKPSLLQHGPRLQLASAKWY